jgi:hypothetical protein
MHTRCYDLQLFPTAQSRSSPLNPSSENRQRYQRNALTIRVDVAPSLAGGASLYIPRELPKESRPPVDQAHAQRALQTRHHFSRPPGTLKLAGMLGLLLSAAEEAEFRGGDPQDAKKGRSTM